MYACKHITGPKTLGESLLGDCGRYQIRLETNDVTIVNHVSEVLKNQLAGSGKQYRIECNFETEVVSFIRWLLR